MISPISGNSYKLNEFRSFTNNIKGESRSHVVSAKLMKVVDEGESSSKSKHSGSRSKSSQKMHLSHNSSNPNLKPGSSHDLNLGDRFIPIRNTTDNRASSDCHTTPALRLRSKSQKKISEMSSFDKRRRSNSNLITRRSKSRTDQLRADDPFIAYQ